MKTSAAENQWTARSMSSAPRAADTTWCESARGGPWPARYRLDDLHGHVTLATGGEHLPKACVALVLAKRKLKAGARSRKSKRARCGGAWGDRPAVAGDADEARRPCWRASTAARARPRAIATPSRPDGQASGAGSGHVVHAQRRASGGCPRGLRAVRDWFSSRGRNPFGDGPSTGRMRTRIPTLRRCRCG